MSESAASLMIDTLKMEAGWYPIYQTPWCHTPRDGILRNNGCEILKSHKNIYLCTVQMSEAMNWLHYGCGSPKIVSISSWNFLLLHSGNMQRVKRRMAHVSCSQFNDIMCHTKQQCVKVCFCTGCLM